MGHRAVTSPTGPTPIGPYSHAVINDGGPMVFVSGVVGIDPATGQVVPGGIKAETERLLKTLSTFLEAAGTGMDRVLKTTVFLIDMSDFAAMNEVYARHFPGIKPARSTVEVRRLPKDVRIEIEAVAAL